MLVCFSTPIHVGSADHPQPTMTSTMSMGDDLTPFKYKEVPHKTSLLIEEQKCLNKINQRNKKQ